MVVEFGGDSKTMKWMTMGSGEDGASEFSCEHQNLKLHCRTNFHIPTTKV
jgi:hypothetical protein